VLAQDHRYTVHGQEGRIPPRSVELVDLGKPGFQGLFPIYNGSMRRDVADLLHRMSSLELHKEVQQYAEQDHRDDDQPADRVTQHERDGAGYEKDDDEGIGKEAKKTG
jgi:hypothetical protein